MQRENEVKPVAQHCAGVSRAVRSTICSLFAALGILAPAAASAGPADFANLYDQSPRGILDGIYGSQDSGLSGSKMRPKFGIRVEIDCEKFVFRGGGAISEPVILVSRTIEEECGWVGETCIPEEHTLFKDEKNARIELRGRSAADPDESFFVCLEGQNLSIKTISSPWTYNWFLTDAYYLGTRSR